MSTHGGIVFAMGSTAASYGAGKFAHIAYDEYEKIDCVTSTVRVCK